MDSKKSGTHETKWKTKLIRVTSDDTSENIRAIRNNEKEDEKVRRLWVDLSSARYYTSQPRKSASEGADAGPNSRHSRDRNSRGLSPCYINK